MPGKQAGIGSARWKWVVMEGKPVINLKESLLELASANAERALTAGDTLTGGQAVARLALLMSLLDSIEASEGKWSDCDLLPDLSGCGAAISPAPGEWQH